MQLIFSILSFLLLNSTYGQNAGTNFPKIKRSVVKDTFTKVEPVQTQYFIIKTNDNLYGYRIYVNGELLIEQKIIPGHSGTKGFSTIEAASACAELVIKKIKNGESFPVVSKEELQKLIPIQ